MNYWLFPFSNLAQTSSVDSASGDSFSDATRSWSWKQKKQKTKIIRRWISKSSELSVFPIVDSQEVLHHSCFLGRIVTIFAVSKSWESIIWCQTSPFSCLKFSFFLAVPKKSTKFPCLYIYRLHQKIYILHILTLGISIFLRFLNVFNAMNLLNSDRSSWGKEDAIPVTLFGRGSRLPRKGDLIEAGLALQEPSWAGRTVMWWSWK